MIPGNAVMIRSDGPQVLVVDAKQTIRARPVKLGRDLGDKVEIASGLNPAESVVANPTDALHDGAEVKVQTQSSTNFRSTSQRKTNGEKIMNILRQLQLIAHGEPSDVIELNTVSEPALGQEDVLISMEAAPLNPSDFLFVRGMYGVRPVFPSSVGAEGVGRVANIGSKVDAALRGKRVLILPTYEQGTWADEVVVPVRNLVPMSDEADPLQLSMIGINPATAYLLLNRYASLMPGDWIGQTAANAAMGQYIIALAKLAGVKTLNLVRREEAAEQVRQLGGDRVVVQGDNLHKDIEEALDGKKLSLVLDMVGGTPVGELAKSLKPGGSIVVYATSKWAIPSCLARRPHLPWS